MNAFPTRSLIQILLLITTISFINGCTDNTDITPATTSKDQLAPQPAAAIEPSSELEPKSSLEPSDPAPLKDEAQPLDLSIDHAKIDQQQDMSEFDQKPLLPNLFNENPQQEGRVKLSAEPIFKEDLENQNTQKIRLPKVDGADFKVEMKID